MGIFKTALKQRLCERFALKPKAFNAKGMTTLIVLASLASLTVSTFLIANWIMTLKQQVLKTENMLNVRFAINSTMDFAIFGLKQKYCFNSVLLLDSNCDLNHPASVERLIMSADQENFIKEMIRNGVITTVANKDQIHIDSIEKKLMFSEVSATHPLFRVFQDPKLRSAVSGVWIKMERDNNLYLPRSGREVYVRITVELIDMNGNHPMNIGPKLARLVSNTIVYPREVGSFALLVSKDLHLDLPWNSSLNAGDVAIHQFAGSNQVKGSPGLTFLSPVFVNNSIHLPNPNNGPIGRQDASSVYTPVSFSERVVLGNGWIYENGVPYAPATAGAFGDRNWNNNKLFGGFKKGLENDGAQDGGLLVFGKAVTGVAADASLMKACIERTMARTDRRLINASNMSTAIASAKPNDYTYRFTINRGNEFLPQDNALLPVDSRHWGTGTADRQAKQGTGAIANLRILFDDRYIEGQLPYEGSLIVKPEVGSPTLKVKLAQIVTELNSTVSSEQEKLAGLKASLIQKNTQLTEAKVDLKVAHDDSLKSKTDLAADKAKPLATQNLALQTTLQSKINLLDNTTIPSLNAKISDLTAQIADLESNQIPNQNTLLATTQEKRTAAQTDLTTYEQKVNNPPEIKVTITTSSSKFGMPSANKALLEVSIKNVASMIDQNGNHIAPSVWFKGYDLTYYKSQVISAPENPALQGYLNFTLNGDHSEILPPKGLADAPTNPVAINIPEDATDYASLDQKCMEQRQAQTSQAFGGAAWDINFTPMTRHSWNFAGTSSSVPGQDPILTEIVFDSDNSSKALKNSVFQVRSIVGICRIKQSADIVTGFFGCDQLIIESRTKPLRIIGSFVVGAMSIHPSAYMAGIVWSTIYHPQATSELRALGILKSMSGKDCNMLAGPIWHPTPSIQDAADRFSCNAISLRAKADPFQWTSVDPDCGLQSGASATTCKRKLIRFYVVEQSREDFL